MAKRLAGADKEVLVEVVRFTQKSGLRGCDGGWKDFLARNDRKFGASVSDPRKRSRDVLLAFLQTFPKDFQKYFGKLVKRHNERSAVQQYVADFPDEVSPQQKLVQLTAEHPEYRKHYCFPSYQEASKVLQIDVSSLTSSSAMLSIDCEMVLCSDGTEAVVRVCVVDDKLKAKLDILVNPSKTVADYRTHITGVSKKDLEGVTSSLVDVQKSLKRMLSKGNILIGHSLHRDLCALKIDYSQVIDTAYIFKYANLPTTASPSLNSLCKAILGYSVREEGEPHNCLKDAEAAMNLVLAKLKNEFNDPIEIAASSVTESDVVKLLAHRIPVYLPCQELCKIFSGNPNIDDKIDSRIRGEFYSTCISFNDVDEVDKAFEELDGQKTKDSGGRLQKHVLLKLDNGDVVSFYVRKMVYDSWPKQIEVPRKRPEPTEDPEPKKEHAKGVQQKKRNNFVRDTEDPEPKKRPEPIEDPEPKKEHAEGVQRKKRSKKHANKEDTEDLEPKKRSDPTEDPEPKKRPEPTEGIQQKKRSKKHAKVQQKKRSKKHANKENELMVE
ncbi:small RNA degrading nuclease 1 [Zea mays]|uniref:Small RNA degrading nuclease 3 n=1 Tax=Zea mays TaxID=4577 RepID=A0A1D6DW13_MAIZE|nr:small RNA degrading nuclease 1 [Zea mays]ONM12902.1 Small RNA degrading nuclease 3 [Zea mays]|eukprot:XP_008668776.2 small RNA degrading nuclease 1 [Zea mays]